MKLAIVIAPGDLVVLNGREIGYKHRPLGPINVFGYEMIVACNDKV